jgi:hypothetical protein
MFFQDALAPRLCCQKQESAAGYLRPWLRTRTASKVWKRGAGIFQALENPLSAISSPRHES